MVAFKQLFLNEIHRLLKQVHETLPPPGLSPICSPISSPLLPFPPFPFARLLSSTSGQRGRGRGKESDEAGRIAIAICASAEMHRFIDLQCIFLVSDTWVAFANAIIKKAKFFLQRGDSIFPSCLCAKLRVCLAVFLKQFLVEGRFRPYFSNLIA